MEKRRRRRTIFDLFDLSPFEEFDKVFESLDKMKTFESGYSITVTQSGGKTVVHAKVGKDVDVGKVREELQMSYPGAQIIIEGGKPIIEEVKEEATKRDDERKEKMPVRIPISGEEKPKKSLIEEVKE
jgi:hypothetical protein